MILLANEVAPRPVSHSLKQLQFDVCLDKLRSAGNSDNWFMVFTWRSRQDSSFEAICMCNCLDFAPAYIYILPGSSPSSQSPDPRAHLP